MDVRRLFLGLAALVATGMMGLGNASSAAEFGKHGYADSNGVKIHYVTMGKGPLVVMIHGFPDYWYTWRKQMPALAKRFQVVAIDQRGYNKSDKPKGVKNYTLDKLAGDVVAVIRHFKKKKAIIVGHDWGGAVAWTLAIGQPKLVDKLIILNLPHPNGLRRELANNPQQQKNSGYARAFQLPGSELTLSANALTFWVKDAEARKKYIAAFKRSSFLSMVNYYRANYPKAPYKAPKQKLPKVQCSVLMFHGLKDKALLPGALNDTWKWVAKDLTIITIPGADHFVQQDAADFVTKKMVSWLKD